MTKHRRTKRRSQKGGFLEYFGFGSSEPEDPNAPKKTLLDSGKEAVQSGLNTTENFLGTASNNATSAISDAAGNVKNSVLGLFSSNDTQQSSVPNTSNQPVLVSNQAPMSTQGGRRRRRSKSMKGGKGGLGLTYYAAPVEGLKVAEPKLWQYYANGTNQYSVKGGSRKRRGRKSRRTRRHKRR